MMDITKLMLLTDAVVTIGFVYGAYVQQSYWFTLFAVLVVGFIWYGAYRTIQLRREL